MPPSLPLLPPWLPRLFSFGHLVSLFAFVSPSAPRLYHPATCTLCQHLHLLHLARKIGINFQRQCTCDTTRKSSETSSFSQAWCASSKRNRIGRATSPSSSSWCIAWAAAWLRSAHTGSHILSCSWMLTNVRQQSRCVFNMHAIWRRISQKV